MLKKNLVCVTGLPRSGSTLLCQLLGQHPDLYCPGHSSPLCATLINLRQTLSDDPFLLSQLDLDCDRVHQRLLSAFRGFIDGWFTETDRAWVVDKHRGWMHHLELLHLLDPECRLLVCVREPGQIWGSIESQHRKTLLLDFPDRLAQLTPFDRADRLFGAEGVVGAPMRSLQAVQDRDLVLQSRLYYVVFEHLMQEPVAVMRSLYEWLGLSPVAFDPTQLQTAAAESDSHYRCKYPHQMRSRIQPPAVHSVPPRIETALRQNFGWFYETFYPGFVERG